MASMTTSPDVRVPSRWYRWSVPLGIVLASIGFTWMVLAESMQTGRLAVMSVWDDSSYLYDAAKRYETLARGGWGWLGTELTTHPPHAPYSTFMAFGSFLTVGRVDWAPYATNAIIVLLACGYACRMMRRLPRLGPVIGVLAVCLLPLTGWSVHEFRPDLACGLFTSILLLEIVLYLPGQGSIRYAMLLGGLFGLALLTKPTVFPVTGLLTGFAMLLSLARTAIDPAHAGRLRSTFVSCVVLGLTGLALWAPYMMVAHDHIIPYIVDNIFGENRKFWVMKGSMKEHAAYYLYGYGGRFAIGYFRLPFLLWMVAAGLLVRGSWRTGERSVLMSLGVLLTATYVLPTMNEVKQPFFGAVFYFSYLFIALLCVALLVDRFRSMPGVQALFWSLTVAMLADGVTHWESPYINRGEDGEAPLVQREVYEKIASHAKNGCKFFVTTSGWINGTTIAYSLTRDGFELVDHKECWQSGDLAVHSQAMDWADMVITSEPGTGLVDEQYPAAQSQEKLLSMVQSRPDLTPIGKVTTRTGKSFHIFAKTSYLASLPSRDAVRR